LAGEAEVRAALAGVVGPGTGAEVKSLTVAGGEVSFVLEVDASRAAGMEPLRQAAESAVRGLEGVTVVRAVMTAHSEAGQAKAAPKGPVPDLGLKDFTPKPKAPEGPKPLPGVRHVVAVSSGKGGVGKSTVSANLAVALAGRGLKVGLLDADVYGPSQPRMLGVSGRPSAVGNIVLPLRNHGVSVMSLGFMVEEEEAIVWRGPMLMGALQQMLAQVQWGKLDVLIVDLPPGTGDVQMTLAQKTAVAGAVVVSTPQDIALIDAKKGIDMFRRMEVPILGLVENMSAFVCDGCGKVHHPFGHGGARAEAERLGVPFLGEIPLMLGIRTGGDTGAPVVAAKPEGPEAEAFWALADGLIATLELAG
jgi:ATP-binding protein involved in chromosome partitioning